ncbi:McbC-like oxidoreductase for polypeptide thioester cyclization [Candidatus Vecturithrix granuli]|uniref:McbC-like oxidoreductase for polypeptide thioester cyclization n=1 Tax=Vecturithrix granuli TaxID=1499967 RepID=A0A081C902_VECG1|nr:McbC-like oxidoreductase for polypeptide thioester cyclization [Candidatus Vecturithrix granuli]
MEKLLSSCLIAIMLVFCCTSVFGQGQAEFKTIKLEPPTLEKGVSIMQALKQRKSVREFSDQQLAVPVLSELLWAANGVNRDDGKRTAPAAMNIQAVDLYVMLQEGVYLYDAVKHELAPVAPGDFRKAAGMQPFVATAPLNLLYVADFDKFKTSQVPDAPEIAKLTWVAVAAGCQAQNVALYCASEGLGNVVRASFDAQKLAEILQLRPAQSILLAQTIGYSK